MVYISKSPIETAKIATDLANKIKDKPSHRQAVVIAFEGELGAGKTTFIKAFAKALGVKKRITSPTFVIMKPYGSIYHVDAYRLKDHQDLIPLGIKEIFSNPDNIVLIEWSERVSKIIPKNHITVHIDHISETTRKITIKMTKAFSPSYE